MNIYRFLDFVLDEKTGTLLKNGIPLDIRPKAWLGLKILIDGNGALISQNTLIEKIWHDQDISPKALTNLISDIRKTLQDSDESTKIISTIVRRGYIFTPKVSIEEHTSTPLSQAESPDQEEVQGSIEIHHDHWSTVGRKSELGAFESTLNSASEGHRQIIILEGCSGVGKSTLLLEFQRIALARKWDFQWCNSIDSMVESEPLGPMIRFIQNRIEADDELFRAGNIEKIAPCWAVQFPKIFPPAYIEKLSMQLQGGGLGRMLREGCNLINEMVKRHPLVMVFDDIQWADLATLEFVSTLIQSSQGLNLIIIVSIRAGESDEKLRTLRKKCWREVAENKGVALKIGPLDEHNVLKLVVHKFGNSPEAIKLLPWLMAVTEGHPLYLRTLLNFKDFKAPDALFKNLEIDKALHTLEGLISSKINHLPEIHLQVLEIASCLHGRFTFEIIRKISDIENDQLESIISQLIKSHILTYCDPAKNPLAVNQSLLSFTHAIFPEVIRTSILKERRKSICQKVVHVLSGANACSIEYKIPSLLSAAKYAHLPLEAAESFRNLSVISRGRFAPSMAKRALLMALEHIDAFSKDPKEKHLAIQICFDLVRICRIMDGAGHEHFRDAIQRLYMEGLQLPGPHGRFLMSYSDVMINMADGRADLASKNADDLTALIPSIPATEKVYCLLWIGMSRAAEGDIGAAKNALALCLEYSSTFNHSLELTEAHKIAEVHYQWVLAMAGEYDKSTHIADNIKINLRDLSGPAQISLSLYWIGETYRLTGRNDLAPPCYEEALEIARLNDFPTYRVACRIGLIGCNAPEDRDIPQMWQLVEELKRDGELWRLSSLFFLICESQLHQGDFHAAHQTLEQLEKRMDHWGHYVSQTYRLKGLLACAENHQELGKEWLGKALRHALQTDFKLVAEDIYRDCQRLGMDSQDLR